MCIEKLKTKHNEHQKKIADDIKCSNCYTHRDARITCVGKNTVTSLFLKADGIVVTTLRSYALSFVIFYNCQPTPDGVRTTFEMIIQIHCSELVVKKNSSEHQPYIKEIMIGNTSSDIL